MGGITNTFRKVTKHLGARKFLSGGAEDNFMDITDPLGIMKGPESVGSPKKQKSPGKVAREEAIDSAFRSEIISKNTASRSSTAGAGERFIAQQTDGFADLGPTIIDDRIAGIAKDKKQKKKAKEAARIAALPAPKTGGLKRSNRVEESPVVMSGGLKKNRR